MAVYTDGVHMVADTIAELHGFALKMGLGRHFFHGVRKGHPHYDLTTPAKLKTAVRLGATYTTSRHILTVARTLAAK